MTFRSFLPLVAAGGLWFAPGRADAQQPAPVPGVVPPSTPTAAVPAPAAADDFLPESYRADRHASTWSSSPFSREVLPPPAGPVGPQGPTPWDGWQIAAVDKFGGEFTVGLVTKKNEFRLLKVGQQSEEGVKVTKVESSGIISETVVHVTDGARTGEISFNTKRLVAAPKGVAAPKAAPQVKAGARQPVRRPVTPQQAAAAAAAKQRAANELHNHLIHSANANKNPAGAAAPTTTNSNPPSRVRRRSVVLPPSTGQ